MADVLIRNLDENTLRRLKKRALRNERSLQAELLTVMERAARVDVIEGRELARRIRRRLKGRKQSDTTAMISEDRRR